MKTLKAITLSLVMMFGLSSAAYSIEGLGIGVSGNYNGFYAVGEEIPSNNVGNKDRKEAGAFLETTMSVFIEYDAGPVSIGVDYFPGDISTPENTNIQHTSDSDSTNLTNTVQADFKDLISLYAILPLPIEALEGAYLKAGLREATVETNENLGTGGSYGDVEVQGWTAGLGYQVDGENGMSFRLEATATQWDDVTSTNDADTSTKVKITDMMSASATVSILKTF
tara:strand:+ start:295 stop:969 length:675 start_codon:yes stop_codon:yes gene_type:complete